MARLKGTLTKLGTRTAHYWFPYKIRIGDRLIPWWPFITRQRHETKHYYILKEQAGTIQKEIFLPFWMQEPYVWHEAVDYKEHLLTFSEVHRYLMNGDYDNYKDHKPDQFIGKEIEVWTDEVDHKHFVGPGWPFYKGFKKEHYPHHVKEVTE